MRIVGNMALNEHLHPTIVRSGNNSRTLSVLDPVFCAPTSIHHDTLILQTEAFA